ncbi:helix-turn-helix transcriptional regulator [Ramlibacter solisilvae]|uniref:AraC family transcriptional regulator n=1 Tax=Ramlibacter tataouinensis TaxID=94132 RepID=UPI0009EE7B39|nr:helix-turn-helix transcriptional regulator [Ramlibacter tataouinensis]
MRIAKPPVAPARAPAAPFSRAGPADNAPPVLPRSYPRGTRLGLHMHREAQLLFAAEGLMQVTTPRGRWLVPHDRAVWIPPRVEHAVDVLVDIEMRALLVDADWLAVHPEADRLDKEYVVNVGPLLREVILACFGPAGPHPRRAGLLLELALFELPEAEDVSTFMPLPSDSRAARVARLVLADPTGAQDLEQLAADAGASARTITRLFSAETRLSFKEWRQRARIMAAVEALGTGRLSVKQVAAQLGFSSSAAFAHAFRQVMGTTPGAMLRTPGSLDQGGERP